MIGDDNTVNINRVAARPSAEKPGNRPYHHGDLRASLVAAGLELLKERTADGLSLREVVRAVGVSATAVYRHFPDKQALLYALCEEGARTLATVQREAMAAAGGGKKGFEATGQAYVRFALANPALFRLMMKAQPPAMGANPKETTVNEAMQVLRANVATILPSGASDEQRRLAAIRAWSMVHGVAVLMLDGQLPRSEALIEALIAAPIG
jgi:AcrR family transcriptional regulator